MISKISFGWTGMPTPSPNKYEMAKARAEQTAEALKYGGKYIYVSPAGDEVDISNAIKRELADKYMNLYYTPDPTVTPTATPVPKGYQEPTPIPHSAE